MSFPRYPSYKDSGVEWLGEVPEHWEVRKISQLFIGIGSGTTPKSDEIEYYEDGDIPWVVTGDLNDRLLESCSNFITKKAMQAHTTLRQYPKGSVAMAMYGATIGKASLLGLEATVNQACCVLPPSVKANENFLLHFLISARNHLISLATGGGQPNINQDIVRSLRIPLPPVEEQSYITTFLNHETAKIDALIAEQQRLIELLQEKRKAVISHAVTKGLNPDAPMKDSGVEWLGEVPEHWDIAAVGHRYSVQLGKMLDANQQTGNHSKPYLRVADVQWGEINTEDLPEMDFPPEAEAKYRLKAGDLLVNEGGSYVGRSAIWSAPLGECYYQKALHRLRAYDATKDSPHFMYCLMEHATRLGVFIAGGNQTTIDHLTAEQLRRYRFAFPPMQEQEHIASYLRLKTDRLQQLTTQAESMVGVLIERRSAIITAAVTGQIDVRGLAEAKAGEQ